METMENEFRALFKKISPSVVVVEQVGRVNYFCIGSIILSEGESTFILTQSRITNSSEKLSICFSNGFKQSATLLFNLEEEEKLCILKTKFYPKCKAMQLCEDDIDHTYVGTIAPANRSSVFNLPGFVIQKPCEAGGHAHQLLIKDSEDYFTFTSQYGDKSANGVSRLLSAAVFNMKGEALGIAIDDMEFCEWPKKVDGTIFHKELYFRYGFLLKIGVTVRRLKSLLRNFWRSVEKIKVDGTASSSTRAQKGRSPSLPPKKGSPSKKVCSPSPAPKKASSPRKASPPAESAVLCIDHLSRNVNEAHLKEIFGKFGEIVNVEHSMDRTVNPRGYGYIEFKKRVDAEKALLYMDGGQIDGNVVKLRFTHQQCQRAASPMKAPPPPPKRDAPQIEKGVGSAEKDAQQRPRESSPQKRCPNQRAESPKLPPDPSPRRRPESPPIHRRPDPSPVRRGDTPPHRRPLSPVRRRSPSPPPRRHRSPMRPSPRRVRRSPSPRRRSPGPLRRRSPPPRRLRSPPRRPPPPYRYIRSPPRLPLCSRSRSISPRRGRGPPLRRGRSDSSYSRSPTPPPRKGPRRVSRRRSPRSPSPRRGRGSLSPRRRSPGPLRRRSPPPRRLRSPPPPRRYSRSPRQPLRSRSRSISPRRGRGPPLRHGRSDSSYSRSPTPPPRKVPRVSRSRSPRRPPRGRRISSDSRSSSSPSPRRRR